MKYFDFESFKLALKRKEEEKFKALQEEIKKMRDSIEKVLTKFMECTSNQAKTNYAGLEMY